MRKIVILLVLILSIFGCYTVAFEGVDTKFLKVASYDEVSASNKKLDTQISELNRKNTTEFESKKIALTTAIKNYKDKKEQYEALAPTVPEKEEEIEMPENSKPYDIDFLWTIVGNYATEEGINLNFVFVKSASPLTSSSSEYFTMTDINFTISGSYNSLIEFIYDIEDDDRLGFEISNFKMTKGGDDIQATFTVKGIPVNNENLSSLTGASTPSPDGSTTNTTTGGNTAANTTNTNTTNTANTNTANNTAAPTNTVQ